MPTVFLTLAPIEEKQRRSETDLWREFERVRPAILGAVLNAVAHGLQVLESVKPDRLPRTADFALWATACEPALCPAGTVSRTYAANAKATDRPDHRFRAGTHERAEHSFADER